MNGKPCEVGCTCGRHKPYVRTEENRQRISESMMRAHIDDPTLAQRKSEAARRNGLRNFTGGEEGDAFAAVLCPQGFVREYHVQWGPGRGDRFVLDFGHPEALVDVELDGAFHGAYPARKTDEERDALLRSMGWKVIRIKH